MIFTATPEPEYRRVRLDFDTENSDEFTQIEVLREGRPIRSQPPTAGLSQTFCYDYEARLDRPVNYAARVGWVAQPAESFNEPWTDLSQWYTTEGASVAAGRLAAGYVASGESVGEIPETGRIDFSAPFPLLATFGFVGLRITRQDSIRVEYAPGGPGTFIAHLPTATSAWSLSWSPGWLRVTHSGGATAYPFDGLRQSPTAPAMSISAGPAGFPAFAVNVAGIESTTTLSATATLDIPEALLIHPSQPSLTVSLGDPHANDGDIWVKQGTDDSREFADSQSVFEPAGRREAVVFPTGVRKAGKWTALVHTQTLEARNRVLNLCEDMSPILLRSPAHADWDLPDGWYAIKALNVTRPVNIGTSPHRQIELELIRVAEPPVTMVPVFTWGELLLRGYTWGDLVAGGYTWMNVLTGELP